MKHPKHSQRIQPRRQYSTQPNSPGASSEGCIDHSVAENDPRLSNLVLLSEDATSVSPSIADYPLEVSTAEDGRVIEDLEVGAVAEKQHTCAVILPGLRYPKSIYEGYQHPLPTSKERFALELLLDELRNLNLSSKLDESYNMIGLTDFTIYRPSTSSNHPLTMAPLNDLKTRRGDTVMLFDGILHVGNLRRYVKGVPFEVLAIDGYCGEEASIMDKTSIQSLLGKGTNTFYLLEKPSSTYKRFYEPFAWLVDFAKHFVEYLLDEDNVCLSDFQQKFWDSISLAHGRDEKFRVWHSQFGRYDFRQVIAAHFEFLWKEAVNIERKNADHHLWKEVDHEALGAIKPQPLSEKETIVTPFVFACFEKLYFGSRLESRDSSPRISKLRHQRAASMHLATSDDIQSAKRTTTWPTKCATNIRIGDIVGVPRDTESKWKDSSETWYAYVQGTGMQGARQYLHLLWIYRSTDTSCGNMHYPFQNELFLSDHCNCADNDDKSARVFEEDLSEKLEVVFCKTPAEAQGKPFIRQTFNHSDSSFRTFKEGDLNCTCWPATSELEQFKKAHPIGTTVLAKISGNPHLEVVEVIQVENVKHILIRRLLRRRQAYGDVLAKPNELVYTKRTHVVSLRQIIRKCHVRAFSVARARSGKIPPPYSYDGAGDCWIVTGQEHDQQDDQTAAAPPSFVQGFDPSLSPRSPPLNGLGLFSGGGSFERGLEEGGAVKFRRAIDWDKYALHTYRANADDETLLFHGSVNDYHARALAGDKSLLVATVGEVQFIAAGSPCQGFSRVQPNKLSDDSLRNASMVAAVATSVDIYYPERGLLENVHGMVMGFGSEQQNVFQQLVCCLVAMGYQVQQFNVDAWSSGSPQSRSRVFISYTAPGLTPLPPPPESHSHPLHASKRRLGTGANGAGFGVREIGQPSPFPFKTAGDATGDLPSIGEGAVGFCIPFPDHRLAARHREWATTVMSLIPLFPKCMSWRKSITMKRSPIPAKLIEESARRSTLWAADTNKAFTRNDPDGIFPTIITKPTPQCTKNGKFLHWQDHRPLTIMEVRRAQSFPDHEVLIGNPDRQWKVVGNSVARTVAVAFGMSLRQAWLEDESQVAPRTPRMTTPVTNANEIMDSPLLEEQTHDPLAMMADDWPEEDHMADLPIKPVYSTTFPANQITTQHHKSFETEAQPFSDDDDMIIVASPSHIPALSPLLNHRQLNQMSASTNTTTPQRVSATTLKRSSSRRKTPLALPSQAQSQQSAPKTRSSTKLSKNSTVSIQAHSLAEAGGKAEARRETLKASLNHVDCESENDSDPLSGEPAGVFELRRKRSSLTQASNKRRRITSTMMERLLTSSKAPTAAEGPATGSSSTSFHAAADVDMDADIVESTLGDWNIASSAKKVSARAAAVAAATSMPSLLLGSQALTPPLSATASPKPRPQRVEDEAIPTAAWSELPEQREHEEGQNLVTMNVLWTGM